MTSKFSIEQKPWGWQTVSPTGRVGIVCATSAEAETQLAAFRQQEAKDEARSRAKRRAERKAAAIRDDTDLSGFDADDDS